MDRPNLHLPRWHTRGPGQISGTQRAMRGTFTYASASVVQRAIGFLLLPIYARVLTPSEYGEVSIVITIAAATGAIFGLGLETAVLRTLITLADRPLERDRFLNTVGGFALLAPTVLALAVAGPIGLIAQAAFGVPATTVALGIIGSGLTASTVIVPFAVLRAEERLRDYLQISAVQAIAGITLSFVLVVILRWGVSGWILATALTAALTVLWGLVVLSHPWSRDVDTKYLTAALAFGLPIVPHALSHWALAVSDRAILGLFVSASDIGLYYIAYQFTLPITIISIAVAQSVQPLYARSVESASMRTELARVTTYQVLIVAFLVMAVALLGPPVIALVLPPSYIGATGLIAPIAIGIGFFGLYLIPMNVVTIISGRTRWVWLVTVTAAATNIGLNLLLIPRFGVFAAAVDTALGYGALLLGVAVYMRTVSKERLAFEWGRIAVGIVMIAGVTLVAYVTTPDGASALDLVIRGLAVIGVGVAMMATGLLPGIPGLGGTAAKSSTPPA